MNVDKSVDENFNGVISVTRGGEIIFQKAFGYADLPNNVPNEIETRFQTASAGKVFVAVGILQLMEKERLFYESKIGDLLDIDLNEIDPKITVRQLLTHTSGIPDYFDESKMEN